MQICKHCDFSCLSEYVMLMHVQREHVRPIIVDMTTATELRGDASRLKSKRDARNSEPTRNEPSEPS